MKKQKDSFSDSLYCSLLIFIFLEEPKTTRQLVEELENHGIFRDIRTIQRNLVTLQKAGFPICREKNGNEFIYKWSDTKNILDALIQAKASACFKKTLFSDVGLN